MHQYQQQLAMSYAKVMCTSLAQQIGYKVGTLAPTLERSQQTAHHAATCNPAVHVLPVEDTLY